jgi:hypothetical protein
MNAILLTMLALGGADVSASYSGGPAYVDGCDPCASNGHGHQKGGRGGWCGPMPQSCYNPSFGCYASTRFMHRYPAFHNYYYRSAYNYRHYFDYPWHAGLHEPTSQFSHHVPGEAPAQPIPTPPPSTGMAPSGPVRSAAAQSPDAAYYQQ